MVHLRTSICGLTVYLAFILILDVPLSKGQNRNVNRPQLRAFASWNGRTFTQIVTKSISETTSNGSNISGKRIPTSTLATELRGDQPVTDDALDYDLIEFFDQQNIRRNFKNHSTISPFIRTLNGRAQRPQQRVHPCEQSSCYPATGNLLIGRENRLTATSTCGLRDPERFCIVSHLEEKKCFLCDTRRGTEEDPELNHRIGQIIYKHMPGTRLASWWQSENGKQNVSIQLDLEAEFHFTHLIIVFATFRPAAMLIERSYDLGKTWHVYKYFAHNCAEAFPGVPRVLKNITDVICDHRYSGVEPSRGGEVIHRILPPNMKIENPYSEHVQNMLKMTNLRINFTKLHNLGDTLLDDRQEIQEKYYYAISNMIVRGSCSCYGHASRCLPLDGIENRVDMVHGRCECTHNTKGLNCEECEDFFNDLPWSPALGKLTNACKRCSCNNHATSCHFDQQVYEQSGRVSGGVCDNCQHNTQGQHCEACMPYFYRDPYEDIQSPYVCKQCDCAPDGSLDEGICDSLSDPENDIEAGQCHCKTNVTGRRCDQCKQGHWNLDTKNPDGCEQCTCNLEGTLDNSGCNQYTGECTCKALVTGKDCDKCLPQTYGLSESTPEGCSPCNCDAGLSLDNFCDVFTGECRCRPHITGRRCDIPQQNYYIPHLHTVIEAEWPDVDCSPHSGYGNCTVFQQPPPIGRKPHWTGPGYRLIPENTELTFTVDHIPKSTNYDVVIRYTTQTRGDWEDAKITLIRPDEYPFEGLCRDSYPGYETSIPFRLRESALDVVALRDVCLEQNKVYKFKIYFERHRQGEDNPAAQILIDSLALVPNINAEVITPEGPDDQRRKEFHQYGCNRTYYSVGYDEISPLECNDIYKAISGYFNNGATPCTCNPTGSISNTCNDFGGNCQCKPHVAGRQCDRCAPGTYGFGPEGCKPCDCNGIGSKDIDCDLLTGQCNCHPNTYGRECDQCQPGFWNFPNCQLCQCNGHTQTCDVKTGQCLGCQDFTMGEYCDQCIDGFYGDPYLGSEIGCRPCRCPDTVASGHTHAESCELDRRTNDMVCLCKAGYSGPRCDVCADNYYGNPDKPGGVCQPCNCSGNVNAYDYGNCDSKTGKCLKCLHETTGDHCEFCREGYYGDALRQSCRTCRCSVLGTNSTISHCNRYTGQCPCLPNVQGLYCDECIPYHWKIAKGEGCERCNCDSVGSLSEQCNPYDGQCSCKQSFGGRQCDQCQANFWGNPNVQCQPCDCDRTGASQFQCNRETGQCICHTGIGGYKCDQCDRGYLGRAPHCSPCGECFDNWDLILTELEDETRIAIARAKEIKTVGATGAYSADFNAIESKLNTIDQLLANTTVSPQEIERLENRVEALRKHYGIAQEKLIASEKSLAGIYAGINIADVQLESLRNKSVAVKKLSNELKENATHLQEASVEGALNLTRDALQRVHSLSDVQNEAQDLATNAQHHIKRTETLINRNQAEFDETLKSNGGNITQHQNELTSLFAAIPKLNSDVCDRNGDPCDALCGGAGCGHCGGVSCERGALTKSEKALKIANDTAKAIQDKKEDADNLIRLLSQTKTNASEAYRIAKTAHDDAESFLNRTKDIIDEGNILVTELTNIINNNTASPEEIRILAENTTKLNLKLVPQEINALEKKITDAVASLENVETIISNTQNDLQRVEQLKKQANNAKEQADKILNTANEVVKALDEADGAQEKAQSAIKQAGIDIELAKNDLEKIDSETQQAELPANETANKVEQLTKDLNKLLKNTVKNELDAKEIKDEADRVESAAVKARDLASQLRTNFESANNSLAMRAKSSESARERAQKLLQRASKLTVDTTGKLRELDGMTNLYQQNDKKLTHLEEQIKALNSRMSIYLLDIQQNADRYRQCSS